MRIRFNYTSLGDSLGLTAIAKSYHDIFDLPLELLSPLPEPFLHNPDVTLININQAQQSDIVLNPCTQYSCNILNNFFHQVNIKKTTNRPHIYLSESEKDYALNIFHDLPLGKKKIVVCLEGAVLGSSNSLRYENVMNFLQKIKINFNCSLILVGKIGVPLNDYKMIFDKQIYNTSMRQVFSIISNCDLYLGVDTGLFHVAAGLGLPQVVFFRNNNSCINSYENTYYHTAEKSCSGNCLNPGSHIARCFQEVRCMDSFNFDNYLETIGNILV